MAETATKPPGIGTGAFNEHNRGDKTDSVNHYPKGFITAYDNHVGYKGNTGEIIYGNALQHLRINVSSAELLAINGTPKELIPAPGAGKIIIPTFIVIYYDYNSIAYTVTDTLDLEYGTSNTNIDSATADILKATSDYIHRGFIALPNGTPYPNESIIFTMAGNPTVGNSPLVMDIWYNILDYN